MTQLLEPTSATHMPAPPVTGVACVYLPVTDVYRSAQWYIRNFGLTCSPNTPLHLGMQHVILNYLNRGPSLFLIACQPGWTPLQRSDGQEWLSFCFMVDDIDATLSHLQANGVRLQSETPLDRDSCGLNLRCYDLDGNKIEIVQPSISS